MSVLTISQANLSTLENNLDILSSNINSVSGDIININGQITDFNSQVDLIKKNVKSLEEEIRDFMFEIKGSSIVSNAQNDILLKEAELNKKYGHYDKIRRKVNGILNSIDLNTIRDSTLINESEQIILNTPDYYLSYTLVALCSWFRNDKETAYKALNKSLKLNESKTSLLLCLVHLKLGRKETALKWIKNYLNLQNPLEISNEIVYVLDSLSNNVFDNAITEELILFLDNWYQNLKSNSDLNNKQIERWNNFFSSNIEKVSQNEYPYIVKYTNGWENINKSLSISYTYYNANKDFNNLLTSQNNKEKDISILLNSLLHSYEKNELELRKSILKNKLIIEEKGNISASNKRFNDSTLSLNDKNDLLTELNNIILDRNDLSIETKKLAISYSKENIISSLNKTLSDSKDLKPINITINKWNGSTIDGINEKELQVSITSHIKNSYFSEIKSLSYINIKTIISIIVVLFGTFLSFINFILGILILLIGIVLLFVFLLDVNNKRNIIEQKCKIEIDDNLFILNNILSEIVDVNFIQKRNTKDKNNLIDYIKSFNKDNYITNKSY